MDKMRDVGMRVGGWWGDAGKNMEEEPRKNYGVIYYVKPKIIRNKKDGKLRRKNPYPAPHLLPIPCLTYG